MKTLKLAALLLLLAVAAACPARCDSFAAEAAAGWALFSFPFGVSEAELQANPTISDCQVHIISSDVLTKGAPLPAVSRGSGFWLYCPTSREISFNTAAQNNISAEIDLRQGWNIIGNPFGFDVPWNDTNIKVNDTPLSQSGLITEGPFEYTPEGYDETATLAPWKGYWVKSAAAAKLKIVNPDAGRWTFMVYMGGDNDLEGEIQGDLDEMKAVTNGTAVRIIVQYDTIQSTTFRGVIENGTLIENNLGELNMGAQQTLEDFIDWSTANYPSENNALILWDHGGGWETWAIDPPPEQAARSADYLVIDVTDRGVLDVENIRVAIENTGLELEIIGFDACLMATVEVAYEMRNVADLMVASQETIPGAGWPYDTILSWLTANPSASARDFAAQIVSLYTAEYAADMLPTTLSVTDLAFMENIKDNLSLFAENYLIPTEPAGNQTKTGEAYAFISYDRDAPTFLAQYTDSNAAAALASMQSSILQNQTNGLGGLAGGLSIFLPASSDDRWEYINRMYNDGHLQFCIDNAWCDWIQAMADYYINNPPLTSIRFEIVWEIDIESVGADTITPSIDLCVFEPNTEDPDHPHETCSNAGLSQYGFFTRFQVADLYVIRWTATSGISLTPAGKYEPYVFYQSGGGTNGVPVAFRFINKFKPLDNHSFEENMNIASDYWSPGYYDSPSDMFVETQ